MIQLPLLFWIVPMQMNFGLAAEPVQPPPVLKTQSSVHSVGHAIDEVIPEASASYYSPKVCKFLKKWPPPEIPRTGEFPKIVWMQAIRLPDQPTYIGVEKQFVINAPMSRVVELIENFEDYVNLFEDLKTSKILSKDGNKVTTYFERYSPVFFVPNIKYRQVYIIDRSTPNRVVFRYQLIEGNSVSHSDGIVVVEGEGDKTRLTGFDFYDANWGLVGALANGKIWKESVVGAFKGDLALKNRAEHPDWKLDQIKKAIEQTLDRVSVEPIQYVNQPDWDSF